MGLENPSFLTQFNSANPLATDKRSQGDDHIRRMKAALLATFPSADHAIYLEKTSVDVASGATTNVGAAASNYVRITGTTTITAFDTVAAGIWRFIRFAGILTFTHSSALILPGAANITTAAGDTALAISEGSGNWRVIFFARADGSPVILPPTATLPGTVAFTGVISPSITADQDDWAPTGLSSAAIIRLTTDATRSINGLTGGSTGRTIFLFNVGSHDAILEAEAASSTAANRFDIAEDLTISPKAGVILQYDNTTSRWRLAASVGAGQAATAAEIWAGTEDTAVITPAGLAAALAPVNLGDISGAANLDFSTFINARCRFTGNVTWTPTNYTGLVGRSGRIAIIQDGTGNRTLDSTHAAFVNINGQDVVLSTTASKTDVLDYSIINNNGTVQIQLQIGGRDIS